MDRKGSLGRERARKDCHRIVTIEMSAVKIVEDLWSSEW